MHGHLFFIQKNKKEEEIIMKIENIDEKLQKANEEALKVLQTGEDKAEAIVEALNIIATAQNDELIKELKEQSERAEENKEYAKSLNLKVLSKEEKNFYENFKDIKQAITAKQIDILPSSIIDRTLEDVKKESGILSIIDFAPADVKRWFSAEKSGTFSWSGLTEKIKGELTAAFESLNIEVSKLTAYLIIPKAIRELSLPFVDKYFTEILKEVLNDGMEFGFLDGNGKDQPIGIYKSIKLVNEDGTHKDKIVNNTLKSFRPKALAEPKKYLSKDGKRKLDKIYLICHPNDEADYVAPAIYDYEGNLISSYKNLEVKQSVNNPIGKAALVIPKKYVMGFSGFAINEFDQTLALDDADVVIGKVYANGKAVDDNVAYVFDVTKLEEYIPTMKVVQITEEA